MFPKGFKHELAKFTPGEVEAITGVSTTLQRDWRRREYLPQSEGHARFDFIRLCEIWFMSAMAARGIGPAKSRSIAGSVAIRIFVHALAWRDSWEGPIELIPGKNWGEKAQFLTGLIVSGVAPHSHFLWFCNDAQIFTSDISKVLNSKTSFDPSLAGPIIALDLEAAATAISSNVSTPIVCFDLADVEGPK